jgi:hypothetical protein
LNFLKKAGAVLLLVAVFASSCNKYADDFKQINTKLDALATQVAGVSTLSTSLTSLAAQVTALQTAVAALPNPTASITALTTSLAAATTKIDAITTQLNAVATAGTATKAVVDGLKTDLTALATKVAADNTALKAQITALGTSNDAQTVQLTALVAANTALAAQITATQAALIADNDVTQAAIAAMQLIVNSQKATLDQLLANSNMFTGDVTITSPAEVTFWAKKIGSLGMINGSLTINTTNLAAKLDSVNYITKNINAVIGTGKNVTVTSTSTTTLLDLSKLVSVSGDYVVSGVKISDSNLTTVGGNFSVNYDGAYAYPNLTTVGGNLTLTKVTKSTSSPVKSGTTSISLPSVSVTGSVFDGTNAASVLVYPDATSVALAGGVTSLTVAKATSVALGSADYASGLIISAPTAAAVVDLSKAVTAVGGIAVVTGAGGTVNLSGLTSTTSKPLGAVAINVGTGGTVDFSKLNAAPAGITLVGPADITFPLLASGALTSDATTVTLAKHDAVIAPVLGSCTTLTMGAINAPYTIPATVVTASISGKAATAVPMATTAGVTAGGATLKTLTLGGTLATANVTGTALTSLTTSGVVNSLTVNGCTLLTAMTLNHTHYVGGPGSELIVTSNPVLTGLNSGVLDYPKTITVTGNPLLTSLTLSSYHTPLLAAPGALTSITINTNKLSGTYTNAIGITPTTPYVETTITSADLHTLKAFVAMYPTVAPLLPAIALNVNLDSVKIGTGSATTLSAKMGADTASTTITGAGTGIDTQAEFALVQ